MTNIKKRNKTIILISVILLFSTLLLLVAPMNQVSAATTNIGSMSYNGSTYYCHYSINLNSTIIHDGSPTILAKKSDITIDLNKISVAKNPLYNYTFDIVFKIISNNTVVNTVTFYKKMPKITDLKANFTALSGTDFPSTGSYLITWTGSIKHVALSTFNGQISVILI